jgi:DNA-binding PadR family transcriptional regulator
MPRERYDEDARRHLPLAPHLFEILLSLAERPRHGYRLIHEIRERSEGRVDLATSTLYSAIRTLRRSGLIEDVGERPDEESGGPPRRYYRITDLGLEVSRLEALRLQRVAQRARERLLESDLRAQQAEGSR